MSDWTEAIKWYGEIRDWRPLPTRHALKGFCEDAGIERRKGIAADRAFRLGYAALAKATPEERAACRDFEAVKQLQRKQEADAIARAEKVYQEKKARLDAMADQPGWLLMAGEETELVARGTRDEVRRKLYLVTHCPRDPYAGKGCWVILAPDGTEAESGFFDGEMYW